MDDKTSYTFDDHDGHGDMDVDTLIPVGNRVCGFLDPAWGGDCRYHCSGTGNCDVLHRLGFQNLLRK